MIPKECKRLAEVDFPIAVVSKHAAREKSIRHGHPSTLHLWWARRPLAACRAMLLGLLLPDPCDDHCPNAFKAKARELLPQITGKIGEKDEDLRQALLKFIGDFANWDRSADRLYLEVSRSLVRVAHGDEPPVVVDPFAGGGSIPLEALRLGCEAFAFDLNPVACLILKVLLEDIPRHGAELAEELRRVGAEIKAAAEKELAEFYPPDPDGSRPIAYLWARTVSCESSGCGAEIPLLRSFWLSKKAKRKRALQYQRVRQRGGPPRLEFEIFEPKRDSEVPTGTVSRAKAACPCCNIVLAPDRVRAQLSDQHGGSDVVFNKMGERTGGARLMAVVTLRPGEEGRYYRAPTRSDYDPIRKAQAAVQAAENTTTGVSPIPDESVKRVPVPFGVINVWVYGMTSWGHLFTARQKLALITLTKEIGSLQAHNMTPLLAMAFGRCVDHWSANAMWIQDLEAVAHTFGRQAIPIVWDFVEAAGFGKGGATWEGQVDWVSRVIEGLDSIQGNPGQVQLGDAAESPLPHGSSDVWFTDPPYYDAVPYSYISDFFYVWLKRLINKLEPKLFASVLTPKAKEIVAYLQENADAEDAKRRFERLLTKAFAEGRRVLRSDGVGCIVFAHKSTEGWEALLSGMIQAGWTITASWPISTERPVRLRSLNSATLSASVHLICRPRQENAEIGDWSQVYRELPVRVGDWINRLQSEGVRGADLVFACIGPAMEIYSRYSKVEDAEGREIPLGGHPEATEPYRRGFLAYVWETVGRLALQNVLGAAEGQTRNGGAAALEEDARLTALFLWTLQSSDGEPGIAADEDDQEEAMADDEDDDGSAQTKKGLVLIYDVVRRFAQPLGIHLNQWEGRIIETKKGIVRLLQVEERAPQLFGEEGASAVASRIEVEAGRSPQADWIEQLAQSEEDLRPRRRGRRQTRRTAGPQQVSDEGLRTRQQATTLDRVHAAMLLQSAGKTNALRALLRTEQERGPDFLRLANALSALYPKDSEEKRLLDAMLLAVPR